MSAMWACTACRSAIGRPNVWRRRANATASSSARWARPTMQFESETRL